jgi:stearoyl-CoA desaturase (delta-9 desaturase)
MSGRAALILPDPRPADFSFGGSGPEDDPPAPSPSPGYEWTGARIVTLLLVVAPIVGLALCLPFAWGRVIDTGDIVMASAFYLVTGFGVAVGFHRLFSHKSFKANRVLKIVLAVAGTMALEGSIISWVAIHRRHHVFSDQPGDPHSPHRFGPGPMGTLRGFVWAHVGWLFTGDTTDPARFAPDLRRDPDLVAVDRLFPVLAVASLVLPFFLGLMIYGTFTAGLTAVLWAGLIRMAVLHHVTWSINSICHMAGRRPFTTTDRSTNFAPLALLSYGESWHNFHHSSPASARHGALPHQIDLAARLIRLFEKARWATKVRWPTPLQIAALKVTPSDDDDRALGINGDVGIDGDDLRPLVYTDLP